MRRQRIAMIRTEEAPACPYCGTAWTAAMLLAFKRHSRDVACECCVVLPGLVPAPGPSLKPAQDLCCDSCGKPIYSAPTGAAGAGRALR